MKTILLKFSGPLQSWGTGSNFETRHTDKYPSKSAVVGLIAAAFGYRRCEDEKISQLNELDFAVRVDQQGNLLKDYHIARSYKKSGKYIGDIDRTYVTNRYYLEDAIFVVALASEKEGRMDEIEEALKNPYFQPYMGRRSLPLSADFFLGTTDKGPVDSLEELEWQAKDWYKKRNSPSLSIYADADLLEDRPKRLRKDRVTSFSQKNRQFAFRYEARKDILKKEEKQRDHDAFSALGD